MVNTFPVYKVLPHSSFKYSIKTMTTEQSWRCQLHFKDEYTEANRCHILKLNNLHEA